MIDTFAYDRREKIKSAENFFNIISSTNYPISFENKKLEKEITEKIKYEYSKVVVENEDDKNCESFNYFVRIGFIFYS